MSQERGKPFYYNYTDKEYNAATQNWAIVQDNRGIIYVGNDDGILQYDGTYWKKIKIANYSTVRSLAVDSLGVVYVGAHLEFGFLKPDKTGNLIYSSLLHLLDSTKPDFIEIWSTRTTAEGAFFLSENYLFHYKNGTINTIAKKGEYYFLSFVVNGRFYVNEIGRGLEIFKDDSLVLIKGGELMKKYGVYSLLPYKNNGLLIGISTNQLLAYDPNTQVEPYNARAFYKVYKTDAIDFLKENQLYNGAKLDNNNYAYGTTLGGLMVINENIEILETINQDNILMDESVYFVHHTKDQPTWLALDNGLSKLELNSPIRYWDESTGFKGTITDIIRHKERIYIAAARGVYYMENNPVIKTDINRFKQVKGLISATWQLIEFKDIDSNFLLAGTGDGVYQIENDTAFLISDFLNVYSIYQSRSIKNRVYVGLRNGLAYLDFGKEGIKQHVFDIEEIKKEIRYIEEDKNKNLWLSSNFDGLYKIEWRDTDTLISKYDTAHGLTSLKEIVIINIDSNLWFGTQKGLFDFDEIDKKFVPVRIFGNEYVDAKKKVNTIIKDSGGNFLLSGTDRFISDKNGSYHWDSISLKRIPIRHIEACYLDSENYYWIGGTGGLFRFDQKINKNYSFIDSVQTLIRKVIIAKDSTIFNGYYHVVISDTLLPIPFINEQPENFVPEIDFKTGSITFYYSLPFYEDEKSNEYSYLLKGFDKNWSGWTKETKKEYTNLSEGSYSFYVIGKNIYGLESKTASYSFEILPPLYRTWYAFLLYVALLVLFITIIIRIRTARLKHEKQKLEDMVIERTAEIHSQKEEIESQAEWLSYANQNMLEQKHEILFQSERLQKTNDKLEKLSIIARETDNAVSVFDKKGDIEWFNEGFTRLYGYSFEEYVSEKGYSIFQLSNNPKIEEAVKECISRKKPVIYEFFTTTKSSEGIWVQTTMTPIIDENGNAVKLITIDSNITQLKEAEAEIQRQRDELAKANATKDTFFSIIAHDLRSPFSSFVSLTNLMVENMEDFSSEEIEKYLIEIRNTSQKTFNLIENLLDWARLQKGEISFNPKETDAATLINENIELLKENAQQKKIHLISKVKKETKIFADENMLLTIFRNLISNAIKFTEEEGEIIVSSKKTDNFIEFAVKDNGVGIVKENIGDIFRIDKRHTTLGTKKEKGTGLGLILCKEFIEKNGGEIRVESEKDKGTTLFFTLPKQK